MKMLTDFLPLLIFYGVYRFKDIYWATGALIVSSALLLLWMKISGRKIEKIYLVAFGILVVLGSTTILVHDDTFLKWRPTVVNAVFAAVFWFSPYFGGGKPLTQRMLGAQIHMSPRAWLAMNHAWAVFFLCISALNIIVAYTCSQKVWVNFKVFGVLGLTAIFLFAVMAAFHKQMTPIEPAKEDSDAKNPPGA